MAELNVLAVSKSYGNVRVLDQVSVFAEEGAFVVLVGPSGCGKSTLLHAIAGLHPIDSGSIAIANRDVTTLPARERDIAMVFQSYALYPTMSVSENIGFPLKMRGIRKGPSRQKVEEVARLLQIETLLDRKPRQLSGGQRQRVAIGRALVRDPKLFLFDEPLSNLDASLRVELRAEIKRLHQTIKRTIVYVTHDQIEAMTLATKIVIMNKGVVQQVGTPSDVYHNPSNLFVARFIGSPSIALIKGKLASTAKDKSRFAATGVEFSFESPRNADLSDFDGKDVIFAIRPEHIKVTSGKSAMMGADVDLVEPTGPEDVVSLQAGEETIVVRTQPDQVRQGQKVRLDLNLAKAMLFDPASGNRLF